MDKLTVGIGAVGVLVVGLAGVYSYKRFNKRKVKCEEIVKAKVEVNEPQPAEVVEQVQSVASDVEVKEFDIGVDVKVVDVQVRPVEDEYPFWGRALNGIKRQEVVVLGIEDFEKRHDSLAKGYHRCTVNGLDGIIHLTRNNQSAVVYCDEVKQFYGISTSNSMFGGKELATLSPERVKQFMNGI